MSKKIILTRSYCNRALKMLRLLSKKDLDEQIIYLTCHMMRSLTGEEKQLLKQYEKGRPQSRQAALQKIKQTEVYDKIAKFWNPDRLAVLLANRSRIENYRGLTFAEERSIDDAEMTVSPPKDLAEILEFLKLTY